MLDSPSNRRLSTHSIGSTDDESSPSSSSSNEESTNGSCCCCDEEATTKTLNQKYTTFLDATIYTVAPSEFHKVVIIGGGPNALALASRLREPLPASLYTDLEHARLSFLKRNKLVRKVKGLKRTIVPPQESARENFSPSSPSSQSTGGIKIYDSTSSKWMGKWNGYFNVLGISHLRSPMFFHPSPRDVDGLVTYAHSVGREAELKSIDGVVGKEGSKNSRRKKMNTLISHHHSFFTSQDQQINERSRQDYFNPSTSIFSDFCQSEISHYALESLISQQTVTSITYNSIHVAGEIVKPGFYLELEDKDGQTSHCAAESVVLAVGPQGKKNLPEFLMEESGKKRGDGEKKGWCHSSSFSEEDFEFPSKNVSEKISRGEEVTIVVVGGGLTSAQITELAIKKGVTKVILLCRHQLKVSHFDLPLPWISKYSNLLKHAFFVESSYLAKLRIVREARGGGSITHSWMKSLKSRVKEGRLDILEGVKIADGEWDEKDKKWRLKLKRVGDDSKLEDERILNKIDYLVCSTGFKMDLNALPFLSTLLRSHPIEVVGGRPVLTEDLQWNKKLPLFVVGAYAMLQLGPDALNLAGSRNGAERVASRLLELERSEEDCRLGRGERLNRTTFEEKIFRAGGDGNYFSNLGGDIEI